MALQVCGQVVDLLAGVRPTEVRWCWFELMKSKLNARGTKRLKLEYDILLSGFAFNFNLRRYTEGRLPAQMPGADSTTQAVQYVHDCKDLWLDHPEYEAGRRRFRVVWFRVRVMG